MRLQLYSVNILFTVIYTLTITYCANMVPTKRKKVTYILGAGASFGTLPLVKDFPDALKLFSTELRSYISKGDTPKFSKFYTVRGKSLTSLEGYIQMANNVNELANEVANLASFDTLAKRLTIRGESDRLIVIKAILTSFFMYRQAFNPVSFRHDSFFASILGLSAELPENINILSWNYDNQIEKAYSGYSKIGQEQLGEVRRKLNLKIPMGNIENWDGFNLVKINGSADFGHFKDEKFNLNEIDEGNGVMNNCVKEYFRSIDNRVNSNITFAWDSGRYEMFIDKICQMVDKTESLVIVGYSFPYFNKVVDDKILRSMNNLKEIFIQDPNAEYVKETIISLKALKTVGGNSIIPISNLNQFYIPLGM